MTLKLTIVKQNFITLDTNTTISEKHISPTSGKMNSIKYHTKIKTFLLNNLTLIYQAKMIDDHTKSLRSFIEKHTYFGSFQ